MVPGESVSSLHHEGDTHTQVDMEDDPYQLQAECNLHETTHDQVEGIY